MLKVPWRSVCWQARLVLAWGGAWMAADGELLPCACEGRSVCVNVPPSSSELVLHAASESRG